MSVARDDKQSDLLTGVAAIAEHLDWPERRVLYQHEKGLIPTFRQGRLICALRSALAEHFAEQTRAARAGSDAKP
ncbi:DNA-binding protein [Sphingobium sp. KCTC 72723]|uniref:DNA-binding protein n=1 Tax=Sphingobium sp. KCTC 72723 TaxID=2733867 RepID=UPI00165DCCA5|nr:DNA-binding protein [Sphingobium sp. KCTC 72723]